MADPLSDLFNFKEKRFFPLTHSVRIFIFGQEVTAWLKNSINVTYASRDSFNTCNFELSNPNQLWQITSLNHPRNGSTGKWRTASGAYNEDAKRKIFDLKSNDYISPALNMNIRKVQLGNVSQAGMPNLTNPIKGNPTIKSDQERRYRLAIGDCIFNKHDPLRIFIKNPYANRDEWVEVFCGYIHNHPITTNWLTGESTLRIEGYCVRQMLTKMRCALNVRSNMSPEIILDSGFYADFANSGLLNHPFAKTSLEQTIRELIIGSPIAKGPDERDLTGGAKPQRTGLGFFKLGNTVCYNPNIPKDRALERWHLLTMFGVHKTKDPQPADNLWLTYREVNAIGEQTLPFNINNGIGGPDSRYLHFLLPKGGTGASTLTSYCNDSTIPPNTSWTTRWDIIRDFAAALDFQVMTSPSGDILVEFPQYGFSPSAYWSEPVAPDVKDAAESMDNAKGLSKLFTFERHQKEETLSDEAEDFPTVLTVTGSLANKDETMENNTDVGGIDNTAYVYSPTLIARYGMIAEVHDVPYAGQEQDTTHTEAITTRLAKIGLLEFTKRMAQGSSVDTSVVYRPFLFPNRPVWLKRSHRMGVLTSVSHKWNIRQDATTDISVGMLMAERYDGSYRLMTGSGNTPIDYQNLWGTEGSQDPGHENCGVRTGCTDPKSPTTVNMQGPGKSKGAYPGNLGPFSPPSRGLNTLYPAFADTLNSVLKQWVIKYPNIKIIVNETFRTYATQKRYWDEWQADKKARRKSKYYKVAYPGTSMHELGLAVDLHVQNNDYEALAKFVVDTSGGLIVWPEKMSDPVHFEFNVQQLRTSKQSCRNTQKKNEKEYGDNAYQTVWVELNKLLFSQTTRTYTTKATPAPLTPRSVAGTTTGDESTGKCTASVNADADLKTGGG